MTVAVTPDGYADAVTRGRFMLPEERRMRFSDLIDRLSEKRGTCLRVETWLMVSLHSSCTVLARSNYTIDQLL